MDHSATNQQIENQQIDSTSVTTFERIKINEASNCSNKCVEIKGWIQNIPKSNSGIILFDIVDDATYQSLQCVISGHCCTKLIKLDVHSTLTIRGKIVEISDIQRLTVYELQSCDPSYFMINPISTNLKFTTICKYLVYGYARTQLFPQTFCCCVCKDIQCKIICFLGDIFNDSWDLQSDIIGKCVEIEGRDVKATACDCYYENVKYVYGQKIICGYPLCQSYSWKIKLVFWDMFDTMSYSFGIVPISNCLNGFWYLENIENKYYGPELKESDTIEIQLDLRNRTLGFCVNGTYLGVAHHNLPMNNYKLAVTLPYDGAEIKLLDTYQK